MGRRVGTDILRGKLGFNRLVVSDYSSISYANLRYRVESYGKETAILALKAGIDVEQPSNSCYKYLVEAVESGEIEETYINRSGRKVPETKFKLGLFENPYEQDDFFEEAGKVKYEEFSQEIAEKSIVMVKNEDNILSLQKNLKIAVIGPSSDNQVNFFGGYSSVGSASTKSSDFDKFEGNNMVKIGCVGEITKLKETLREFGIIFDDEPIPEQKEIVMAMIKQNLSSAISSLDKDYDTAEKFVEKYYPNCKFVKEVMK